MYVRMYDFCPQSPHPFTFPLALAPLLFLPPPSPYSLLLPTPSFFPFPHIIPSLDSSPHSLLTSMKKKRII